MTSKRFKQVKDIYESIIIQEATSIDPNEWLNKLLDEKEKGAPEAEETKNEKEVTPEGPPELPGQLREVEYSEQVPMFPGSNEKDLPFNKVYSPSFALFTDCPVCKTKLDPIELPKGGKQYLYRKECPKCKQLYNKMRSLIEEKGLSPQEAISAASTPKYNRKIMDKIWESQGSVDVLDTPIQKDITPSIRRRVEDALRFRLNVKKDKNGDIIYDTQGFPTPVFPPKYVTSHDLAQKLRWHPDHLISFLEEKGYNPIPLGGVGSTDMPSRMPLEKDQSESERRLRALKLTLKRIKTPELAIKDLEGELQYLLTEHSKLEAPGGPGTPGLNPKHPKAKELPEEVRRERLNAIKRSVLLIKQKIKKLKDESTIGAGGKVQSQIEDEIKRLEPIVEQEETQGNERFKTSWYNVWNMDSIKGAIKEREDEIKNVILPMEKAAYFGRKAKYFENLASKLQASQERLKNEKEQLKLNLDATERKAYQLLYQYRVASQEEKEVLKARILKTMGFDTKFLEKSFGRDLDKYLRLQDLKNSQITKAEEKETQAREYAETNADKFIEYTSSMGYKWSDPKGNKLIDKDKLLSELEQFVEKRTEKTPKSEASSNLTIKTGAGKQINLWDEPEKKEEQGQVGGVHFFGPSTSKPISKEVLEPEPNKPEIEEPEEEEPEIEEAPKKKDPVKKIDESAWQFGIAKGTYYYQIHGKDANGKNLKYTGRMQFTPGYKFENIEDMLSKNIQQLSKKHSILDKEGARFTITVKSPKKRTQSYTFHINEGAPIWHGTRSIKTKLLNENPRLKTMWSQGFLPITDIVEFNGKLYDIHSLGKPVPELTPLKNKPTTKTEPAEKVEKVKSTTLEEKLELVELELKDESLSEDRKEALENEQEVLLRRIKSKKQRDEHTSIPEEEMSPAFYKSYEPSKKEPTEFSEKCPYKGCNAPIPKGAKSCWKCKSPLDTKSTKLKVIMDLMKLSRDVEVIDPVTRQKTIETKSFFVPRFSLITIGLDSEGTPISAKCEELSAAKRLQTGRRAPALPDVRKESDMILKNLMEHPDITEEKREELKTKSDVIYEWLIKKKKQEGKINEKVNPWAKDKPAVGAPRSACKKCPDKVTGPFNSEKLKNVCPEIAKALKSLTKPMANVWDYDQVRLITETERNRDVEKSSRNLESKPWYMADDKKASRFDKIVALSKID